MEKLFLLDCYALIYRAYYAFIRNQMYNSKGVNTSTIFGFVNSLDEVIKSQNPSHIAAVFDPPTPTFRHKIFEKYKANRQETPETIKTSVPYIKSLLEAYQIPILEYDGYEADDVIGTISRLAESNGIETYMMSPDKDLGQLVSDKVFLYKPKKAGNEAEVLGVQEINKRYSIDSPLQIIEIFALWGDSSDNIPGAPGIGEKKAIDLISKYKSIENLYNHIDDISGKMKENLINYREQVELSRTLVTIEREVPLNVPIENLRVKGIDHSKIIALYQELEFKTLLKRYIDNTGAIEKPGPKQGELFNTVEGNQLVANTDLVNINNVEHNYILVDNEEKESQLIKLLGMSTEFCFDTETTGLNVHTAELVGMSFAVKEHEAYYIPVSADHNEALKQVKKYEEIFHNDKILKIGQNIKYDLMVLNKYGIKLNGPLFDTMIAHYLIQPEDRHNMNFLAYKYLKYDPVSIESLIGEKGKTQSNMRHVPIDKLSEYAAEDADITLQLKNKLVPELEKAELLDLFNKVEMPLILVLAQIELNGVKIDSNALNEFSKFLRNEIDKVEKKIFEFSKFEFNISSPKQLGEVLFDRLKIIEGAKKTKTKQYSTSEEVLSKLVDKHPIVELVLDHRSYKKLLNTYVEALPSLINSVTGKIHTSFNQAVAATGRLSSTNPNLQNIPIREENGREIRKAFIPSDKSNVILSADYSQIELRLMAHISGDKAMIEAFKNNEDIHTATAAKIFKTSLENVSREMRSKAKTANFGIIYGISAFGLAQRLNISRTEASELIENYFISYPGIKKFMEDSIKFAQEHGYVETILKRRRYLKDINSRNATVRGFAERNAINAPIQGSAADIIKLAMIKIHNKLSNSKLKAKMILQVHDELLFDVAENELDIVKDLVVNEMQNAYPISVELLVEAGYGKNWLEAH